MRTMLAFVIVAAFVSRGQPALAQNRWEYKAVSRPDVEAMAGKDDKNRFEAGLNKLGADGWELAAVEGSTTGRGGRAVPGQFVFKRPAAVKKAAAAAPEAIRVVPVKNAKAGELAKTLSRVYAKEDGISVIPDERTNSILLRGTEEKIVQVYRVLAELDEKSVGNEKPNKK